HPLYHGGELRYTWEQAKINLRIAKENYDKTKEDYLMELLKAYYDYVKAIKNFEVQDALLKDLEQDLAMSKKEFDKGVSTIVDFLNVQSQYNQAYYSYLSSENTLNLAKSNFLQLLNLDKDPTINIKVDTNLVFKEYNIDLEKCIQLAYENRTDLKINELSLKSAELGEKVARSRQMPRVDLTGMVGRSGETFVPSKLQTTDEYFVGAKVSIPWGPNTMDYSYTNEHIAPSLTVFTPTENLIHSVKLNLLNNLESYTEVQRSEVIKEQAYADLIKAKQTAATQVREAYFNYQESALKVKNSLANKELYQKELIIIKQKRAMGESQTADVVSAKMKLAGEETNYHAVLIENIIAIAKVNKAIGIRNYFK
ncbi:MAG: TolC family protein, partial [Candidatus Omnitrophica bacterium]|nr:TolC family protein [Candidatus Omnitrophota bacterium]